jgi:hypothetical protein
VTLQTVRIEDNRVFYSYQIAFWVFRIQGLICFFRWWRERASFRILVNEIRARMPEKPGIAQPAIETVVPENPPQSM